MLNCSAFNIYLSSSQLKYFLSKIELVYSKQSYFFFVHYFMFFSEVCALNSKNVSKEKLYNYKSNSIIVLYFPFHKFSKQTFSTLPFFSEIDVRDTNIFCIIKVFHSDILHTFFWFCIICENIQ